MGESNAVEDTLCARCLFRVENKRLREALEKIIKKVSIEPIHPLMIEIRDIAQAALKQKEEPDHMDKIREEAIENEQYVP
jgi:hypothetical protein